MAEPIESIAFRKLARLNCYRYGCLYVHTDREIALDKHSFPSYSMTGNNSNMEQFLSLMQGLGNTVGGNDPTEKLPKTLPTVKWDGDSFTMSISLSGTMYFLDMQDYTSTKTALRKMLTSQGWTVNESGTVTSYAPAMNGATALFTDDPVDAAGRAMLFNAMQTASAQVQVLEGLVTQDVSKYAQGKSRLIGKDLAEKQGLGGQGFTGNYKVAYEAYAANASKGVMTQWARSGHPVELLVDGTQIRKSLNGILTDASFTESAFIIDSRGNMYPTQMEVDISITNLYGALFNTMKVNT